MVARKTKTVSRAFWQKLMSPHRRPTKFEAKNGFGQPICTFLSFLHHTNFATFTEPTFAVTLHSISANRSTISSNAGRSSRSASQQSVISSRAEQSRESGISDRALDGAHERDLQLIQTLRESGNTGHDFKESHPKRENIARATERVLGREIAGVSGAHRSRSAAEENFIL
jgi:hypothetical protein